MAALEVPEEAIEKAREVAMRTGSTRASVEAAAPLIVAAELERLANEGVSLVWLESGHKWRAVSADHLRSRARDLRAQASVLRGEGDPK